MVCRLGSCGVELEGAADNGCVGIHTTRLVRDANAKIAFGHAAGFSLQGIARFAHEVGNDKTLLRAASGHGENLAVLILVALLGIILQFKILRDGEAALSCRHSHAVSIPMPTQSVSSMLEKCPLRLHRWLSCR